MVISRNVVRMNGHAASSQRSKAEDAAENVEAKRNHDESIRVDGNKQWRHVGGRSDCRIQADPVHSCGTVTDLHRAFPVTSRR